MELKILGVKLYRSSRTAPAKWSRTVLECSKIILEFSRTVLDMF